MMANSSLAQSLRINAKLTNDIKAKVQQEWLKECVQYFVTENPSISDDMLYSNVFDQFTLANIANTSERVIPHTFGTKKEAWTLKDDLLLQMQFIIDISEPFFDQWRNMHNHRLDEVIEDKRESKSFQSKKKRMFKLELTDGYKTIQAMEMKQIGCLNSKLAPGVKILFIAPIQVVNHIMMIKPENVKIIGGELDELVVVNAYENVLLKFLNKPTTNTPITNYEESKIQNDNSSISKPQNLVKMQEQNLNTIENVPRNQQHTKSKPIVIDDEGDEFDLAMIEAIEEEERKKSQEVKQNVNVNPIVDEEIDDYLLELINLEEDELMNTDDNRKQSTDSLNHQNTHPANDENGHRKRKSFESPDDKNLPKAIKLSPVRKPIITDNDYPFKIEGKYNFITIEQYAGLKLRDKMEKEYAIEASIDVVYKLRATEDEWLLVVQIKDPYSKSTLTARFSNDIVVDLGKRTVKEIFLLRQRMKNGQPQLKMDIEKTLESIDKALQKGPFLMCIQMKARLPASYENIITKLLKVTDESRRVIASKIACEDISLE